MEKHQKSRYLTVSSCIDKETELPFLRLKGNWLNGCGFTISTPVKVNSEVGKLTIVLDQDRSERRRRAEITAIEKRLKGLSGERGGRGNHNN